LIYRAEIDGLRALAVVAVILFHAGLEAFEGGFVGVDVFFVISGYLITTILIKDIESNRFSFIEFYERRSRRILPALFFMMLVCILFSWFLMLPNQMKDFSQSILAVSLFVSNVLFWVESGYFEGAAEHKPLLHTWSLAVEEQYYLLFPVFLYATWRFGKNYVFWIIVFVSAVSLFFSEWGARHMPSANFYLAPARVWELLAGSITAFLLQRTGVRNNNYLSLIGIIAILASIFLYDDATPFPSFYGLVPVVGTVLLIIFASEETVVAKLLRTKVFVGVGLISYSTYLWHQPLLAFLKITDVNGGYIRFLAVILALVLGGFSWRFVEKPFREKMKVSRANFFGLTLGFVCLFSVFGLAGHLTNGFDMRVAKNHLPDDFYRLAYLPKPEKSGLCIDSQSFLCNLRDFTDSTDRMLLVGDSHSVDFQREFIKEAEERKVSADQFSNTGCGFIMINKKPCGLAVEKLKEIVSKTKYSEIIFVASLTGYFQEGINEEMKDSFVALFKTIAENTKVVWIFEPRPTLASKRPVNNIINGEENLNRIKLVGNEAEIGKYIKRITDQSDNVRSFSQALPLFEVAGGAQAFVAKTKSGYAVYRDNNHLTGFGARLVYDVFRAQKKNMPLN